MPRPKKISETTKTASDAELDTILASFENTPTPQIDAASEAYLQTVQAEQSSGLAKPFVNEPIMELGAHEPEVVNAARALDPSLPIVETEDLTARLYALTEQERELIVYGVVDMENPVSEVAAAYNTDPEVVLLAIQIARLQKENHDVDVHRNW